jgi:hypothetical protein
MTTDEIIALVEAGSRVRVRWGGGQGVYIEGTVIAAHLAPSLVVRADNGDRETVSVNLPIEVLL